MAFQNWANLASVGSEFEGEIFSDVLVDNVVSARTFARLVPPTHDISALVARIRPKQIPNLEQIL